MSPQPVTVRFKTFWKTVRTWTDTDVAEYQMAVPQLARQLQTETYWDRNGSTRTNRFTCEDFALRLLVQFAALRGLPIKLTTGAEVKDFLKQFQLYRWNFAAFNQ
ncbi:hypothetical protein DIE21_05985 [Burkholderia sp. Bp9140]|nr:hypothetical protein DIE21_05985 [Burkholderia sp. Bp9140]